MVYSHNLECVSPNGRFLSIFFTKMDESQKTFPKNQSLKGHTQYRFFTIFFSFFRFLQFFFFFFHDFFIG